MELKAALKTVETARVKVMEAIKGLDLEKELGVTFSFGRGKYDSSGGTLQLNLTFNDEKGGTVDADKASFLKYCKMFGLTEADYGTTITFMRKKYTLIGIAPRRSKYPFIVKNEVGKRVLLTEDAVLDGKGPATPVPYVSKTAQPLSLAAFVMQTNALNNKEVQDANRDSGNPFGSAMIPLSTSMLEYYWKEGYTPQKALDTINAEAEAEGRAEAAGS